MHSIGSGEMTSQHFDRSSLRKRGSFAACTHAGSGALRRLARCNTGGVLSIFGLATPVLLMGIAAAVDYGMFERGRSRLQAQVDAAAIAAAREMQLAQTNTSRIAAVAENFVHNGEPQAMVTTRVDATALSVTVSATETYVPRIGAYFWAKAPTIAASATAKLSGTMPLCLLALDPKASAALELEQSAMMTATGCMVYSNSKNPGGLQAKDQATLKAGLVCTAGGKAKTAGATVTPDPVTDCPVMADPLRSRTPPSDTACRFNNTVISGVVQTLQPGVYCGGLKVTNAADVTLASGVYIIKDGPLMVDKGATLRGANVGFYLTGPGSNLTFAADSTISLSAPKDGPLAGLLIFDDPTGASAVAIPPYALPIPLVGGLVGKLLKGPPREHKILSDNARMLLGTIYMPQGRLIIDANKPIADKSAYTVLVVQRIDLHSGPNLILNSDYSATDVPVPPGVGPYGNSVKLTN
jgi:Flp pilus assembly protein TadG